MYGFTAPNGVFSTKTNEICRTFQLVKQSFTVGDT